MASSLSLSFNYKSSKLLPSKTPTSITNFSNSSLHLSFPIKSHLQSQRKRNVRNISRISATVSTQDEVRTSPDDLVSTILSKEEQSVNHRR
ncbi:hypothetical protein IFM89_009983 [Coptis chinensis]|uniref:Uncharacterized protein n=1 Tax=Coptis chinensis TaxID=261450 RepID=A0A835LR86_9MAGN|nr:hypothetical protein IFM89_009983 [Coptis chinensis]